MDQTLGCALGEVGGVNAGTAHAARLRRLLLDDLTRGADELARARAGYRNPVVVAFADAGPPHGLVAVLPLPAAARTDPDALPRRAWLLAAAAAEGVLDAASTDGGPGEGDVLAGDFEGWLVVGLAGAPRSEIELAALMFDDAMTAVDRVRAEALELPGHVVEGRLSEMRPPVGARHPLRVAEAVARLGGRPADLASVAALKEAVATRLGGDATGARPHDDPDPVRRIARRILQRLDGMGKWGGYHTDFAHLARGFAGNDRALADAVGESLLDAGLLAEKPSTGQRHVFLNPRRAGDIRRFIEQGVAPGGLRLPRPS